MSEITVTDTMTGQELKSTEVQAEIERQDEQAPTVAELVAMERRYKDGIERFRADLNAIRESKLLNVHLPMAGQVEAPPPSPYHELSPERIQAEPERGGWVPEVPSILTEKPETIDEVKQRVKTGLRNIDALRDAHDGVRHETAPVPPASRWRRFWRGIGDALVWVSKR